MKRKALLLSLFVSVTLVQVSAQEKLFANYFDIERGAEKGDEVWGKIHLERNKDVADQPIPKDYRFQIINQDEPIFEIVTERDLSGRLMGKLVVAKKAEVLKQDGVIDLTVALMQGKMKLNEQHIQVHVVDEVLWEKLFDRYQQTTVNMPRLYIPKLGYKRSFYKDSHIASLIQEVQNNDGRFEGIQSYDLAPEKYPSVLKGKPIQKLGKGGIEYDWQDVCGHIGALGYAYATSEVYGPQGDAQKRQELKEALYQAILTYTESMPIDGRDRILEGKPIGPYMGDGFMALADHEMLSHQVATHHWVLTDPMVAPAFNLMPDLLKDIQAGDKQAEQVHHNLMNYFQITTSIVKKRRVIDDPENRWGAIQDTINSGGAWADANLGHRSRTLLALPVIWADYNRPLTYVPYWYADYYNDQPFKDFSLSPGWSPNGVVADMRHWMTKFEVRSTDYGMSGFHPDGTISHHIGHGTDAAMVAYGFEWLTESLHAYRQYRDTKWAADKSQFDFIGNRLLNVYPNLIYKGRMDFLVAGRSFFADMASFVKKSYLKKVDYLLQVKEDDMVLTDQQALEDVAKAIRKGNHEQSATTAYWVNEFLVHRRGASGTPPYYTSLKLKSERTVGMEDFSKVRKSWHGASGILALRVDGDEYANDVLSRADWHMLPGLTEEWRKDPLPAVKSAAAAGSGKNRVAGVLSDGQSGMGIYNHLTKETYSSATANKSYFFAEDVIGSMGTDIARLRPGNGDAIFTCIDQSNFDAPITFAIDGQQPQTIEKGTSITQTHAMQHATWVHIDNKGYLLFSQSPQSFVIQTGDVINTTDRKEAADFEGANYILAIDHGQDPKQGAYVYFALPNVTAAEMPALLKRYEKDLRYTVLARTVHALYHDDSALLQTAFFAPGSVEVEGVEVAAAQPALFMLQNGADAYRLSMSNPIPSKDQQQLIFEINASLKPGKYAYRVGGIEPKDGEFVEITATPTGSRIVAELPDDRDQSHYANQARLYNASSIVVEVPKK